MRRGGCRLGSGQQAGVAIFAHEVRMLIRSALNRATRKNGLHVATASDDTFLYVWNVTS
jgi:hypothetical protein